MEKELSIAIYQNRISYLNERKYFAIINGEIEQVSKIEEEIIDIQNKINLLKEE